MIANPPILFFFGGGADVCLTQEDLLDLGLLRGGLFLFGLPGLGGGHGKAAISQVPQSEQQTGKGGTTARSLPASSSAPLFSITSPMRNEDLALAGPHPQTFLLQPLQGGSCLSKGASALHAEGSELNPLGSAAWQSVLGTQQTDLVDGSCTCS